MDRKHRIGAFVLLVLSISALCWVLAEALGHQGLYLKIGGHWYGIEFKSILTLLGGIAPGVLALGICSRAGGKAEISRFWQRSANFKVGYGWYISVLTFPWAIFTGAVLAAGISPHWFSKLGDPLIWFWNLVLNLPFGPLWEEVGWRGYLLPALQRKRSSLESSIIVGVIWGIWHVPMYVHAPPDGINAVDFLLEFCLYTIGLSIVFTWVYNKTSGSLVPVVLLHASLNATSLYLLDPSIATNGSRPVLWATAFVWLASIIILARSGVELGHNRDAAILSDTAEQNN